MKPEDTNPSRDPAAAMLAAAKSHQMGDLDAAERGYRAILQGAPEHPNALHFLGLLLHQRGQDEAALPLLDHAMRLDPVNYQFQHNLAGVMNDLGRVQDAEQHYREALALRPDHVEAYLQLGMLLAGTNRFEEALALYARALQLAPGHHQVLLRRGDALRELGARREAIECYRAALATAQEPGSLHAVGLALREAGETEAAIECFRLALTRDPGYLDAANSLGISLGDQGRLEEAAECYRRVLRLRPEHLGAYHNLVGVARLTPQDPLWPPLMDLEQHADGLKPQDAVLLHFTLGKIQEDAGEYDQAFRYWLEGNRRKRALIRYDADRQARFFDDFRRYLDDHWFKRHAGAATESELPVFVIGMSRSGTTLVEQILASHPAVFGAGEIRSLRHHLRRAIGPTDSDDLLPARIASLDTERLRTVATGYCTSLAERAPGASRITDKLSGNVALVGLIHALFPDARIIHCVRDPLDTCVSCFSKLFTTGHHFSYDLAELGTFYRMYSRMMGHWEQRLPAGRILEVRYEQLVTDFEMQTRRLVEFCGLPWDEACLHFHETRRPVQTASLAQVRRPIYSGSVGRWRRYERHLAPLQAALEGGDPADQPGGV